MYLARPDERAKETVSENQSKRVSALTAKVKRERERKRKRMIEKDGERKSFYGDLFILISTTVMSIKIKLSKKVSFDTPFVPPTQPLSRITYPPS